MTNEEVSLHSINSMSKQEIFNHVVAHLRKQGERCMGEETCAYVKGELRCAAGSFLSPEEAKEVVDKGWNEDVGIAFLLNRMNIEVPYDKVKFLADMQVMHDAADVHDEDVVEYWEDMVREYAAGAGLTVEEA
mgnify:CR=1 FL=1